MCNDCKILIILALMICIGSCKQDAVPTYAEVIAAMTPDTIRLEGSSEFVTRYGTRHLDMLKGALLPPFEAGLLTGDSITETYFNDKVSVINMWFIGCQPCEAEIPGFNALAEKYKNDPVNFLAISRNSPQDLNEFFSNHPFRIDQIPYGQNLIENTFQTKWGYPLTIVADKNKKIIAAFGGGKIDSTAVQEIQDNLIPVIDAALAKG